jgi:hypothetical protein
MSVSCPLYPRKRTRFSMIEMSALCQKQIFWPLFDMIDAKARREVHSVIQISQPPADVRFTHESRNAISQRSCTKRTFNSQLRMSVLITK